MSDELIFGVATGKYAPSRIRLSQLYKQSPQAALERVLTEAEQRIYPKTAFLWTSCLGTCGKTRYGSYKNVSRESLDGRVYNIEFLDYMVSIYFTDVRHNPKTYKAEPILANT